MDGLMGPVGPQGQPGETGPQGPPGLDGKPVCILLSFIVFIAFYLYVHVITPNNFMQGREFSEQFIRQICTDVLRGKSQTVFNNCFQITKVKAVLCRSYKRYK